MADNNFADFNGGEDEDEALRLAIAMSLGKDPGAVVDLTQDSEDEAPPKKDGGVAPPRPPTPQSSAPTSSSSSIFSVDRRQMEEERLARLKKRKAPGNDSDLLVLDSRPQQRQKISNTPPSSWPSASSLDTAPSQPGSISKGTAEKSPTKPCAPTQISQVPSLLPFPEGVVKRTWAKGFPRQDDDIKIEEVLQKEKLKVALLSSYQWDDDWMEQILDFERTKVALVAFAKDEDQQEQMRANVAGQKIKFVFPPMGSQGAMHSKLMLLSYGTYLRIVVPTGNLLPHDWGESGKIENMVFMIDLPRLESEEQRLAQKLTPFAEELKYFLEAQHVDELLLKSLWKYDFSETSKYGFVHSIVGTHTGQKWKRTGYCGLGRSVAALGLGSDTPIELDYVSSSIGKLNYDFIRALYYACQGDSGLKECSVRVPRGKGRRPVRADSDIGSVLDHMRVYFPSEDTVQRSRCGTDDAGTICLMEDWWTASSFPREIFCDYKSARDGILLHDKVIFVRRRGSPSGFAYIGSCNFSESAWGKLSKDKATGNPKFTCRNWECGVLVPATMLPQSTSPGTARADGPRLEDFSMFSSRVPVPITLPAQKYVVDGSFPQGSRRPWLRPHF